MKSDRVSIICSLYRTEIIIPFTKQKQLCILLIVYFHFYDEPELNVCLIMPHLPTGDYVARASLGWHILATYAQTFFTD